MPPARRLAVLAALAVTLSACTGDGSAPPPIVMGDVVERAEATTTTTVTPENLAGAGVSAPWVSPASAGRRYGTEVDGLLTFRGNPTRTFYGTGPVPRSPALDWSFPDRAMCSPSDDGQGTRIWCGAGWTGQAAVFEREGRTWVVFGAYDRAVHFLDADTGERIIADFPTGDIIKGSVTIDPDGYPLVYTGSRDNLLRAISFDGPEPAELWSLSADAVSPTLWNNDWDGAPLVLGDYLFEGGENSQFHVARLNRSYGPDGRVRVDPQLVFNAPGWDAELLSALGDRQVSIENSVAISGDTVYFSNSGGLVQGWDISGVTQGRPPTRTFRFWSGDDTDASVVIDESGMLYVASEWERHNDRSLQVGQIIKLDPRRPDPLVWSVADQGASKAGVWATPALAGDVLIAPTHTGRLLGIDRKDGRILWEKQLPDHAWSSPVVVDDVLLQADCAGFLHAYDLADPRSDPPELWSFELGGCIEATPAVWRGRIYVATRAGRFHAITEGPANPSD